jgi:hypothetical protein
MPPAPGDPTDVIWLVGLGLAAPILLAIAVIIWFLVRKFGNKI